MSDGPRHFSPKQIAGALNVSESSVKRWCDRGVIPTFRTVGGHRRITWEGLERFLQVSGRQITSGSFSTLDLDDSDDLRSSSAAAGRDEPLTREECRAQFRTALLHGHESKCSASLQLCIARGQSPAEAAEMLIGDAMRDIGRAWSVGQADPYQERRAVSICSRLIETLRSQQGPIATTAPIAIGGSLTGDRYQLPSALVELTLREHGWNATNLGDDLPMPSIRKAVDDYRPRVLWLSISHIVYVDQFVEDHNALYADLKDEVALFIGGRAVTDSLRPRLNFTAFCDHMGHLVELTRLLR